MPSRGTLASIAMDEDGKEAAKPDIWHARLLHRHDKSIKVEIRPPCNCIIGEWTLAIETRTAGSDEAFDEYENPTDINIILNPWCECKSLFSYATVI